jgi:hypothetical protein
MGFSAALCRGDRAGWGEEGRWGDVALTFVHIWFKKLLLMPPKILLYYC